MVTSGIAVSRLKRCGDCRFSEAVGVELDLSLVCRLLSGLSISVVNGVINRAIEGRTNVDIGYPAFWQQSSTGLYGRWRESIAG